jgi:hypothetical protein
VRRSILVLVVLLSSCAAMKGEQGHNNASACLTARQDLERAVESFTMLEGSPPASETALVPDYLVVASPIMDLDAQGNVVPAPGSGCT